MAVLVSFLIILSTLAFGSVYAWGYLPLFISTAAIGIGALVYSRGVARDLRPLAAGLALIAAGIAIQLIPLDKGLLASFSPQTPAILERYVVGFTMTGGRHALSVDPAATAKGLGAALALGVYGLGLSTLLSRRRIRFIGESLIAFGVVLALVGMYFREHNNGLVFGFWQARETAAADSFGPFVNRNHFAGWMLMAIGLAIGLACGRLERAVRRIQPSFQRRLDWLSSPEATRMALTIVAVLVMATSLVWTMSRSGILSLTVAIGCFSLFVVRRPQGSRRQRAFGVVLLSVVLLAGLTWRGLDRLTLWFADTRDFEGRLGAWRDGWQVIRDFPLTGTGINTWGLDMLFYQRHNIELWMSHAHNDYLQLLAEGGLLVTIPVGITVLLFLIVAGRRLRQARAETEGYWLRVGACVGLVAIGIQETVEFSLHIPANMFLFATLAAIALSPLSTPLESPTALARSSAFIVPPADRS